MNTGTFNVFPHLLHNASGYWLILWVLFKPRGVLGSMWSCNVRSNVFQSNPGMWFHSNCQKDYGYQSKSYAGISFLGLVFAKVGSCHIYV